MAQQQKNVAGRAIGFEGINTEDSPIGLSEAFCLRADNAVIDQFGRLGAREAFATYTETDNVPYSAHASVATETKRIVQVGSGIINNSLYVLGVMEHKQYDSSDNLLQEDYYIVKQTGTDLDSISFPTLASDAALADADIVSFNDAIYIFSSGNIALKYNGSTITALFTGTQNVDYINPQDDGGDIATDIDGDVACSAYGRLWVSGVNGDYHTIYYSDLLTATQWYDGKGTPTDSLNTGGIIDVSEYWPTGGDRIVAIEAHNGFLIIFGRQSIIAYSGAQGDPAGENGLALQDAITNLGAVSRDSVCNIGSDVLFVDDSGVRSLGRTIQEKSVPIGDLTHNVRLDIRQIIQDEPDKSDISLAYLPNKDLVVCTFSGTEQAYALDMRTPSSTGGHKVTRWTGCKYRRIITVEFQEESDAYLASTDAAGFLVYDTYLEYTGSPYSFDYRSPYLNLGDTSVMKIPKKMDLILVGRNISGTGTTLWGFSSDNLPYSKTYSVLADAPALYGEAKFNVDQYGEGLDKVRRYKINMRGQGQMIRIGHTQNIEGNGFSLQEMNIQLLTGRIN